MPWVFKDGKPKYHDHPIRLPKKIRDALAPLVMVTRKEWGALPNKDEEPVEIPVKWVRLVQTWTGQCNTREECVKLVRDLQVKQMSEGLPDINWNFLIGGDGSVYETRGWEVDADREFDKWYTVEGDCYDIAFIGSFKKEGEDIPEIMKKQLESLLVYGLDHKYIDCCYQRMPFNTEMNA